MPAGGGRSPGAPAFDRERAERFAERMTQTLNGAALALMASLGHRTGLFDVMAGLAPATSEEIASQAGLEERYVREWLGAMVTGGVVDYDAARGRYALPGEHAASLCREGALGNLAASCQWLPVLGCVEDSVVECFERGGGVPSTAFGRVRAVVVEESDRTLVSGLLERVLPLVPGLAERLAAGIDVLDLGCGSGRATNRLARAFPASRFAGYDLSPEAIGAARAEARGLGLENVRFAVRDAAALGHAADFDLITAFDAIHVQARPEAALAAVARALRPAGVFLMQEVGGTGRLERDVGHPLAPFLYALSCMHGVTVSLASGGAGLGAMWGADAARQMLARAGFAAIEEHALPHDARHRYFVARRTPDG